MGSRDFALVNIEWLHFHPVYRSEVGADPSTLWRVNFNHPNGPATQAIARRNSVVRATAVRARDADMSRNTSTLRDRTAPHSLLSCRDRAAEARPSKRGGCNQSRERTTSALPSSKLSVLLSAPTSARLR